MSSETRQTHWDNTYAAKGEAGVSWFQNWPGISLELIAAAGGTPRSAIVDIGGGASHLVDVLVDEGWRAVSVLDVSANAIGLDKARLGDAARHVDWIVADVTEWVPARTYDIWHDRAAFHFLTDPQDRAAYVERLLAALKPGGHAIIATFALDGPEKCSGLPVVRYDPAELARVLGSAFTLVAERRQVHSTPWFSAQAFQFSLLRRA